ncbi:MAG: hypothetical protein KDJ15_03395 [Alphaproteobacteria bacterium]|nr:hypothetical protein [Alphaproteobacteria bacterium]
MLSNEERNHAQNLILDHVRALREVIDPLILAKARATIVQMESREAEKRIPFGQTERVSVDRRKNIETVMTFLKGQPDNPLLRQEIKRWMSEEKNA